MRGVSMWALALLALVAFLPGCNQSPAVRFNNAIVEATQKLHKSGEAFGKAVGTAITSGRDVDIKKVQTAYDDAQKVMKTVKDDVKGLSVPPGKAAQNFHKEALEFLDQEERRLGQDFKEIREIAKNKGSNFDDKQKRINDVLTRALKIEKAHLEWLQDAQRKFAEENHMTLKKIGA
jgi:hypothetical protein